MNSLIAQVAVDASYKSDSPIPVIILLAFLIAGVAAVWKLFVKAGQPGWAAIIPIYNLVLLYRITGRSGWLVLAGFVPFWNIYVSIRMCFDLARVFGRGVGFGFGLLFLGPIFFLILAFGGDQYVGPNGTRPTPFPSGGLAHAPTAP